MRSEPDVDAIDMESVRADRECTDVVVEFEFEQTNGAIMEAAAFPCCCVDGERNSFDD